jgi:hypothetical protein
MEKNQEALKTIVSGIAPKNWSGGTLNSFGMSRDPNFFQPGDKVKWMPSAEVVKNNPNLKKHNMFGLFKRYNAFIKSINDDGSISIEARGIGDNNQFVIRDLLELNKTQL